MKSFFQNFTKSKWSEWLYLTVILGIFSLLYVHVNTQGTFVLQDYRQGSYYTQLALLFKQGQLGFHDTIGGDWAFFNGKYYLYHGPFPALVWLFIRTYFRELSMSFLSLVMLITNLLIFYLIARKVSFIAEFEEGKARILRFIILIIYGLGLPYYLAGKMFVYETSITFGSTFMLAALLLFLTYLVNDSKKQDHLKTGLQLAGIGLLISFAFLSRINLLLAFIPFLLAFIWKEWNLNKEKIRDFASSWFLFTCFMLPILISLTCFGFYNVARFGNPVDFGVSHLTTSSDDDNMRLHSGKSTSIHYGLLNVMQATILLPFFDTKPSYINYTAPPWLVGPFPRLVNVEYGGSIFFSSPLLLFIFAVPFFRKKINKKAQSIYILLGVLFISVATYSYFFMGFSRRYHQDYYPILMIFTMTGLYYCWKNFIEKLPKVVRILFGLLIFICIIWTAALAVHLNCIHTYYGHFDRCLDLKQPIQWFQPLS